MRKSAGWCWLGKPMARKKPTSKKESEPPPALIKQVMAAMGRKGGSAKGIRKARSSEQARAAVKVRWDKHKAAQEPPPQEPG